MARHLFIVSKNHLELYTYLCERFASDANVQVILDRRVRERRERANHPVPDRRRHERRSRPEADAELVTHSHVILTVG